MTAIFLPPLRVLARSAGDCVSGGAGGIVLGGRSFGVPDSRSSELQPGAQDTLVVTRKNGDMLNVPMTCRLDTADEVAVYEAGGVLQRFAQDFLARKP